MRKQTSHYKSIGKLIKERVEVTYGKGWRRCLADDVARALVAREAFLIVLGNNGDGAAVDLIEHGRAAYAAGLDACGLAEGAAQ